MDSLADPDVAFPLVQKIVLLLILVSALVPMLRQRMPLRRVLIIVYGGAMVLAIALTVAHFMG